MNEPQKDELDDVTKTTSGTLPNEMERVPERSILDESEKRSRQKTSILANTLQCCYP